MRKIIVASVLTFIFLVAFGPLADAQMAKQGTFSGTAVYSGTYKVMPLEKDTYVVTFEHTGVLTSDTGKGPLHNMSVHCVGFHYYEKGIAKKSMGYEVYTDPDGDKVLTEFTDLEYHRTAKVKKGTVKFLGGTGKFAGIEGTFEYTRYTVRPAVKGTYQGISKLKGSWKLP
ncbi:MAG: hypothetical protein KAV87_32345 [Desulfobacteraceae bacterium]|jgi:hypothetical protein|nr:hypothetical protein [Desulfobacteraceae bacterium]